MAKDLGRLKRNGTGEVTVVHEINEWRAVQKWSIKPVMINMESDSATVLKV